MDLQQRLTDPLVEVGEHIHVVARRTFDGDVRRHFVGTVTRVGENAIRADGYTFVFDPYKAKFSRRPELRTRLFSLIDANLLIKILPHDVAVANVNYRAAGDGHLTMTDDASFSMDMSEYSLQTD